MRRFAASVIDRLRRTPDVTSAGAIDWLHQCVRRDPQFALAYCLLSKAHIYSSPSADPSEPALAASKDAAQTAVRLAPQMPDAHLAMARYYRMSGDFDRPLQELSGIGIPRNRAEFYELLALAERRHGRWKDALRDGQTAVELDPQNPVIEIELLESYLALRQFQKGEELVDRVEERPERLPEGGEPRIRKQHRRSSTARAPRRG